MVHPRNPVDGTQYCSVESQKQPHLVTMGQGNFYNYAIILTVALGSFTYGFTSSIIGAVFGLPSFFNYFDLELAGKRSSDILGGMVLNLYSSQTRY